MAVPLEGGCPPPWDLPLRATSNLPIESQAQAPPVNASPAPVAETAKAESAPATSLPATGVPAAAAPLDVSVSPNELHVQVEAPFVFHATGDRKSTRLNSSHAHISYA